MPARSQCAPTGQPADSVWLLVSSPMAAPSTAGCTGWHGGGCSLMGLGQHDGPEPARSTRLPPGFLPQLLLSLPLVPPPSGPQPPLSPTTALALRCCLCMWPHSDVPPSSHRHALGPGATSPLWALEEPHCALAVSHLLEACPPWPFSMLFHVNRKLFWLPSCSCQLGGRLVSGVPGRFTLPFSPVLLYCFTLPMFLLSLLLPSCVRRQTCFCR